MSIPVEAASQIDAKFPSLAKFAYCIACGLLIVGTEDPTDEFWRHTGIAQLGRMHRKGTNHDVYIGPGGGEVDGEA